MTRLAGIILFFYALTHPTWWLFLLAIILWQMGTPYSGLKAWWVVSHIRGRRDQNHEEE